MSKQMNGQQTELYVERVMETYGLYLDGKINERERNLRVKLIKEDVSGTKDDETTN